MEIVTLGAIGDSFCGKSLLLLSYTANCVRKVYVPTVLDCMWTTTGVDGECIDLRIWDNTGSDDIEYTKLRPLSYPQTDVFLVCFSLKSRISLLNVEQRWLPEVRLYTEDRPFLLVGCKRVKHCEESTQTLDHGNYTTIMFPYADGVYTYGMNITFVCDIGYEFTDNSKTDVIYCNHDNQWTNLSKTCAIITCPSFNVTNGNVTFSSLEYGGTATITCDPGVWTENNMDTMTVECHANKTWTMIPTCEVQNLKKQSKHFQSQLDVVRDSTDVHIETEARSNLDCAVMCTQRYECVEANYKETSPALGGLCRLFNDPAELGELTNEAGWFYMQKGQD